MSDRKDTAPTEVELVRLQSERDNAINFANEHKYALEANRNLKAYMERVDAENERLRGALTSIAALHMTENEIRCSPDLADVVWTDTQIARAALDGAASHSKQNEGDD